MRLFRIITSSLAIGAVCLPALAQDPPRRGGGAGGGEPPAREPGSPPPPPREPGAAPRQPGGPGMPGTRPQLAPEQARAAWETQAKHLGKTLALNEEQSRAAITAYVEARTSHAAGMEKLSREIMERNRDNPVGDEGNRDPEARRRTGGMGGEFRQAFADLLKTEREKLQSALAKSLTEEQVSKAMPALGTFNLQWDMMVSALNGFNLEPAKTESALTATQEYVVALGQATSNEDREAGRAAVQEARKKLLDTVKPLVSEEQFGQFQRHVVGGGRMSPARGGAGMGPGGENHDAPRGGRRGGRGGAEGGNPNPGEL